MLPQRRQVGALGVGPGPNHPNPNGHGRNLRKAVLRSLAVLRRQLSVVDSDHDARDDLLNLVGPPACRFA